MITPDALDGLVSIERGEVDRRVFTDEQVFELEMRNLFDRAWLFLCHESQVPEPGDFFEAVMGRDNVLVVRQKDGSIRALINSCPHRGNAVCRAEEGNARSFMCTYHGWSFGIDGTLKGVPGFKEFYQSAAWRALHRSIRTAASSSARTTPPPLHSTTTSDPLVALQSTCLPARATS